MIPYSELSIKEQIAQFQTATENYSTADLVGFYLYCKECLQDKDVDNYDEFDWAASAFSSRLGKEILERSKSIYPELTQASENFIKSFSHASTQGK